MRKRECQNRYSNNAKRKAWYQQTSEITLVDSNQPNYFENAAACSKCMLKTRVAMQLKAGLHLVSARVLRIELQFPITYLGIA